MKGNILVINPGSTSTKIAYYEDGQQKFETNLSHSAEEISRFESVMHQGGMRRDAIVDFLTVNGVTLDSVDLIIPIVSVAHLVNNNARLPPNTYLRGLKTPCRERLSLYSLFDTSSPTNVCRPPTGRRGKLHRLMMR